MPVVLRAASSHFPFLSPATDFDDAGGGSGAGVSPRAARKDDPLQRTATSAGRPTGGCHDAVSRAGQKSNIQGRGLVPRGLGEGVLIILGR